MTQLIHLLNSSQTDFSEKLEALLAWSSDTNEEVLSVVKGILQEVKLHGDAALSEYTNRFDKRDVKNADELVVEADEIQAAVARIPQEQREALTQAAERIRIYHEHQKQESWSYTEADGTLLGQQVTPLDRAGLYVPGGKAAYPSSVLMNAIPAKVAGVERLVVVTPTPKSQVNPLVLAAAHLAGVDEIWRVGGAHAVAALAFGTQKIRAVDVITGPGNAWVAEAKRQLYGVVGIDMVAGPSEIVVVADGKNDPEWIAADLLSQSEHDPTSQSILFTDDAGFADIVADTVGVQLAALSTRKVATKAWEDNGAIIVVDSLEDAMPLVNRLAAEHLELAVDDPEALFAKVRHAGSVFLGRHTPEAVGDYVAGPNHVLPTGRRARFSSGLSVLDFMKRTSFIQLDPDSLAAIGPAAVALAEMEGLPAHAESVRRRLT